MSKKLVEWLTIITIIFTAVSAIALNYFGLVADKYVFYAVLICVVTFITYQIEENKKTREVLDRSEHIGSAIIRGGIVGRKEFYRQLLYSAERARDTIDLISIQPTSPSLSGVPEFQAYFDGISKIISKKDVRVRRIVSIPTIEKYEWIIDLINEHARRNNFNLRYVDIGKIEELNIPFPLNVQIIDREDVFIINPAIGYHATSGETQSIWLKNTEIAQLLSTYYEKYWQMTVPLKEYDKVYYVNLDRIKNQLTNQ